MFERIDILNLEWPENERDVFAIAPVIMNLRNKGYCCITGDIFSYIYYFSRYRPKVLLISSFQGAFINHQICQLANSLGITVISLIAEGNLRESEIEEMTWGNNKHKQLYFEKLLLWSQRSQDLMLRYYPQLEGKTKVVGAVGFDRYRLLKFIQKNDFLKKQNIKKDYRFIVGLAGWRFDVVHDTDFFRKNSKSILGNMRLGQLELHRNDFKALTVSYYELIKNNPNVLFIVRPHPGITDMYFDEFKKVLSLENIYYSKPRECVYSISDLISVCDIWGGYETTTCLEAWLLNKQTFLFNPSGADFNRDSTANGSKIFESLEELNEAINDIPLLVNDIKNDINIISCRKNLIDEVIGFDDGRNYIRASHEIEFTLSKLNTPRYNLFSLFAKTGLLLLVKQVLRNLNFLNKIRGERPVDQTQTERMVELYSKSLNK